MTPGYVYLLRMLDSRDLYTSLEFEISGCSYKIGKSKSPVTRHEAIAVKAPYPVELIAMMLVDDMTATEAYFHRRLDQYNRRGEWFALGSPHVDWFLCLVHDTTDEMSQEVWNWHGITDAASIEHADELLKQVVYQIVCTSECGDLRKHIRKEYPLL